jgi:small subunit ribosomal protein S2
MKELLESGVHFGHRTRKWNPKMARYIYTERKGIHIIDLGKTLELFERAYDFVRAQAAQGKGILFVGTKRQVQPTIEDEARRCGAHYVSRRWLGGILTNFEVIRRRVLHMLELERNFAEGKYERLPLKERIKLEKELAQLRRNLDGLRDMDRLPGVVYVVDPTVEAHAVREANILKIPIVAVCDTDSDPDLIDFPIPGNDDAIKSTRLITARIADAVIEGREGLQVTEAPSAEVPVEGTIAPVASIVEALDLEDEVRLMEMWEELTGEGKES